MNTKSELVRSLESKALSARKTVLDMVLAAEQGHITSAYSCAEICTVLLYHVMRGLTHSGPHSVSADRLVMSKAHGGLIMVPMLYELGWLPEEAITKWKQDYYYYYYYRQTVIIPGNVKIYTGGSLAIGIGRAVGMALADTMDGSSQLTFCVTGDGELQEGACWEALMFAGAHRLGNLIIIVDRNHQQLSGSTEEILTLEPLADKLNAFGFDTLEGDGHSVEYLLSVLGNVHETKRERPLCIIAQTVKGKGIDWIENGQLPHGAAIAKADAERAYKSLLGGIKQ